MSVFFLLINAKMNSAGNIVTCCILKINPKIKNKKMNTLSKFNLKIYLSKINNFLVIIDKKMIRVG